MMIILVLKNQNKNLSNNEPQILLVIVYMKQKNWLREL